MLFSMNKMVIHLLMHPYKIDSRVTNATQTLKQKYSITVCCLKGDNLKKIELRDSVTIQRFGIGNHKIIILLSAYIQILMFILQKKAYLLHAHDVTALPIAFIASFLKKIPFIYDSHELWSHAHHKNNYTLLTTLLIKFEKLVAKHASTIITVSDSIATFMKKYFNTQNVHVIRNIPSYISSNKNNILREKYKIEDSTPIFIYQGLLSKSRGSHILCHAIKQIENSKKFKFFILGNGPLLDDIKTQLESDPILKKRIILLGFVEQKTLLSYTQSADVGVHSITNTCLNHDYCLPNKIFEYINANIAVLFPNLTEVSKLIIDTKIGALYNENNSKSLSKEIESLIDSPKKIEKYKNNSKSLSKTLNWNNESKKLLSIYKFILS